MTANAPGSSKLPEWVSRAVFESVFIVLGILGGLAVNEWRDSRERAERVRVMLDAIGTELRTNLQMLEEANAYDSGVVSRLRALEEAHATSIPEGTYAKGLFTTPPLTSAAWESAKAGALTNELPIDLLLALGRAYEIQQDNMEATSRLMSTLYGLALQAPVGNPAEPGRLAGTLSDFAGRQRRLLSQYRKAIAALDHVPPKTQPANASPTTPPAGAPTIQPADAPLERR